MWTGGGGQPAALGGHSGGVWGAFSWGLELSSPPKLRFEGGRGGRGVDNATSCVSPLMAMAPQGAAPTGGSSGSC